jgi:S-formylglutathione hydrolase FrmB
MIIAIPDGDNSFYVNSVHGNAPYENYIINDFMSHVEQNYRVKTSRQTRAISGISRGGYGALMLAMRHPEYFSAASAHSAVLLPVPINQLPPRLLQSYQSQFFEAVFGNPIDEPYWSQHNPIDLASAADNLDSVAWYFDCGTEDRYGFFRGATKLHDVLDAKGIPHEYHLFPGGHGWDYARSTLHRSLTFHTKHFVK